MNENLFDVNAHNNDAHDINAPRNNFFDLAHFGPTKTRSSTDPGKVLDEEEKKNYLHHEYSQGSFYRKVFMPENAVLEKADGKVKNGLLTVSVPKTKEKDAKKNCVPIKIEK